MSWERTPRSVAQEGQMPRALGRRVEKLLPVFPPALGALGAIICPLRQAAQAALVKAAGDPSTGDDLRGRVKGRWVGGYLLEQ